MENKIMQIRIEGHLIGVIGLEEAVRDAVEAASKMTDTEITDMLFNRVSERNYIPSKMKEVYGKALLREYKKSLGQSVEEEPSGDLQVVILGPGCVQCTSLETGVRDVMAEMNLAGDIRHITDTKEIGQYGVMGVPALIINNKIVSVGVVSDKKKIRQWLADATENNGVN